MADTRLNAESFDMLRRYAGGAAVDDIVLAVGVKKPAVLEVLDVWCSRDRVRARQVVAEDEARRGGTPPPAPTVVVQSAAKPSAGELQPGGRPAPRDLEELLAAGLKTDVPRIQRLAEKVTVLVDELAQLVDEHETKAAARARVAELEEQLAKARADAGMAVPAKRAATREVDSEAVRKWAREAGLDIAPRGRVPQAVVDAYEQRPR